MKTAAIIAMFLVGADCILKATGSSPQTLLSPQDSWLWFILGVGWVLNAFVGIWHLKVNY